MPKDLVADLNRRDERLGFFRLDASACALLRDLRPLMAKSLPDIARGFYERLGTVPQLSPLIAGHGKVAHLSAAQVQHWNTLFSADFGEEYFDRARRVGMAHDRIGLEPRWYIAAYSHFIEALFGVVLEQRWPRARTQGALGAILRAALLDMELAVSSYAETGEAKRLKHEMLVLTDNIERDIDQTIRQVAEESGRMVDGAEQLGRTAAALHEAATVMAAAADQAMANVQAVAAATEELEGTSRAIADQVVRSTAVTDEVAHRAGRTAETVSRLEEAAARINDVVKLIQSIAAQTKLLALNATIEAARAGEAGRGFAVVAAEVKTLARQTEDAIGTVSSQASNISSVTEATGHSVQAVVDDIHRVDEISAEVRGATDQQRQATGEISRGASAAADKARELAERADGILNHARVTGDTAAEVRDLAGHVNEQLVGLRRRVTEVLRQSSAGDRRVVPRHRAVLAFEGVFGGQRFRGRTIDLSMRGCLLEQCEPPLMIDQGGHIRIVGVGDFPGHVCGVDGSGVHICFDELVPSVRLSLERTLARLREGGSVLPS